MALRSPTQTHNFWGAYTPPGTPLPTSTNVEVGDLAFDTTVGLVVCTSIGPVVWTAVSGSTSPASPTTSIQYNNAGAFGGSADLTYDAADRKILLEDVAGSPRQFVEIATGSVAPGSVPYISIGEDNGGSIASVTLSADGMLAGGPAILRAEDQATAPLPFDLQILDLRVNGSQGNAGDVLTSQGIGAAPLWLAPGALALPIILSLDGTSAATIATYVGAVFVPNPITLGVNSQARLGTSGTAETVTLDLVDPATTTVVATFSASITGFATVAVTGTPALAAGWYDLVLTAGATSQAFARGLYLTV